MRKKIISSSGQVKCTTPVRIMGNDKLFIDGVLAMFMEYDETSEILTSAEILVFTGMALPQIYSICTSMNESIPAVRRIVFCSDACRRMLTGIQGWECALLLSPTQPVREIMQLIYMWHKNFNIIKQSLNLQLDIRRWQMLIRMLSEQTNYNDKNKKNKRYYYEQRKLTKHAGVKSRQELYFKTLMMMKNFQFRILWD
ncbi:hypothetical protein AB1287_00665 [Enterobacter asburiae]|uniref:hypothetical protein n=1 Tax=Scandinavium sp. UTDF21-P1B TaxID=3446379 RepID=UPI0034717B80